MDLISKLGLGSLIVSNANETNSTRTLAFQPQFYDVLPLHEHSSSPRKLDPKSSLAFSPQADAASPTPPSELVGKILVISSSSPQAVTELQYSASEDS
ncbi:hypothetical protein ACH5RR_040860 [Cinchona calisaya]|uniref:Uncharacterized protein n=1 Tax=Cinchona calisaya TaxID=153742 RepID=A0ABD2XTH4_9GENT